MGRRWKALQSASAGIHMIEKGPEISTCCNGDDYEEMFTTRAATTLANRFRRRGLRGSAAAVVRLLTDLGTRGMTLLEVGGGIGEIQVTLLESGAAASAVNVELSSNWESAAKALLAERGLTDRARRLNGDFVHEAASLPKVDAVILHRVVCCYPDWKAMLAAAASRAGRFVVVTFPRPRFWFRAIVAIGNGCHRLRKRQFRAFIHPPESMMALLRGLGFPTVADHTGLVWHTIVAERPAQAD